MESSSSAVRRRAWINSSRQWLTLEEHDSQRRLCSLPSASTVDDDVFSDGCISGKIENWLLGYGSEVSSENLSQLSFESALKAEHTDTELSLGADASLLNIGEILSASGAHQASCLPAVTMGPRTAPICFSSNTCNSTISVVDILRLRTEDAEETLFQLGFGSEPHFNICIPSRFFTFPSQAQGINFRLFLDAQLQRIRDEDPSLTIASRFRQMQVLTAMANAFYSLYSHVSRTPVQKLGPPEFNFYSTPLERMERFRSSIRSEPRSPVERFKDTVSKMCLYTGSPRGSESTSPQQSPKKRSSLPDETDLVREKAAAAAKTLNWGDGNRNNSTADARLGGLGPKPRHSSRELRARETSASDSLHSGKKTCYIKNRNAVADGKSVKAESGDNHTKGARASQSLQTVDPTSTDPRTDALPRGANGVSESGTNSAGPLPVQSSGSGPARCCVTLTAREGGEVSSCSLDAAGSRQASSVPAPKRCEESLDQRDVGYLTPLIHQNHDSISSHLQGNSFELEEVHSAGEDDFGHSETTRATSLESNEHHFDEVRHMQLKLPHVSAEVVRGDSTHSDSSGYADEEISSLHQ